MVSSDLHSFITLFSDSKLACAAKRSAIRVTRLALIFIILLSSFQGRQLLLLLGDVLNFFALPHQSLNVGLFIKILPDQVLCESFVEDEDVVILIKTFSIDTHEGEEFWVDHFLCLQDSNFIWEDLAQVCGHLFRLFVE